MTSPIRPVSSNIAHMSSKMVASAIILMATLLVTTLQDNAFAEEPKQVYEQAKITAELEFAETIQKAKTTYYATTSDADIDSDIKLKARQEYNKAIEDAKTIRDAKIKDAERQYRESLANKPVVSIAEARQQYIKTIIDARITFETALEDAKQQFDEEISSAIDDDVIEQLEEDYEKTISKIKQIYNDAITTAKAEFDKIKNLEEK